MLMPYLVTTQLFMGGGYYYPGQVLLLDPTTDWETNSSGALAPLEPSTLNGGETGLDCLNGTLLQVTQVTDLPGAAPGDPRLLGGPGWTFVPKV